MEKIDFLPSGNCTPSKKIVEGCANGMPYMVVICENSECGSTPTLQYINMATGITESNAPEDFVLGSCTDAVASAEEVIVGNEKPTAGSLAPTGSKLYYDTITDSIVSANVDGVWVDYVNPSLDVILTAQPTPTATGNTTNLNSTFKDTNGDSWIVDKDGEAIKLGSVIILDGNNYNIVRTDAVSGVQPTTDEAEDPINGDTANRILGTRWDFLDIG
jgi:hypothetical protein